MLVVPVVNSTSLLNTWREEASKVVPAVYSEGLKPSGLPSEQKTRVFASAADTLAARMRPSAVMLIVLCI